MGRTVDWCVSSRDWTTQTPTIAGSPVEVSAPLGGLYLVHPSPSLSLLERVEVAMGAAGVASPSAFMTESGHVRLEAGEVFEVAWEGAGALRELLGFGEDLEGASGYTAPKRSTLLWSPGKVLTPLRSPLDSHGAPVLDLSVLQGPQGRQTVRQEGAATVVQEFRARHVPKAKFWASPPTVTPGEFAAFWAEELSASRRWIVLRRVVEGSSTTTPANLSVSLALGPYVADMTDRRMQRLQFTRAQGFGRVEAFYDVEIPALQNIELS